MHNDFQLAVIGGGIHGAAIANYAAQSGLRVVLIEKNDFASGTSSRSSKMAHGGLRYLELFDFKQVFEGIRAREELYCQAPQLCRAQPFYIPVAANDYWFKFKLSIGLSLYDLFQRNSERRHSFIAIKNSVSSEITYRQKLMGYYQYFDGILNDAELVMAHLYQALDYGAEIYNYTEVRQIKDTQTGAILECLGKQRSLSFKIKASKVINAAGIFAGALLENNKLPNWPMRFSRGSHIIFNKQWNHPALFLPMKSKARYYFVWPHFAGTLVGTTEREVSELPEDPLPSVDELKEICLNLKNDLPASGLLPELAHYAFAGIRALPARNNKNTGELSRRHLWKETGNILSLYGGKLTTAALTAKEGLQILYNDKIKIQSLHLEPAFSQSTSLEDKISLAIKRLKACTLEDLMRRRLYLEYLPDNGLSQLDAVINISQAHGLKIENSAVTEYKRQIQLIRQNLLSATI